LLDMAHLTHIMSHILRSIDPSSVPKFSFKIPSKFRLQVAVLGNICIVVRNFRKICLLKMENLSDFNFETFFRSAKISQPDAKEFRSPAVIQLLYFKKVILADLKNVSVKHGI
jgi:hypothetical protein